jgi:hypothetical protein
MAAIVIFCSFAPNQRFTHLFGKKKPRPDLSSLQQRLKILIATLICF